MSEIPEQYRNLLAAEPRTAPERTSPRLLLVYGPVKHGKTEAIARLRGCRVVDMDAAGGGTKFVAEASLEPFRPKTLKEWEDFCKACSEVRPYSAVAFDHLGMMEDWAIEESTRFFKSTPIGQGYINKKLWDGKCILTVPGKDGGGGPGWGYLRAEMGRLLALSMTVADRVIWVAHLKEKYGEQKDVREAVVTEVDLIGQAKTSATGKADAFGLICRRESNLKELVISFRVRGGVAGGGGSRCKHLEGREIVISRMGDDGKLDTFWHLVYPELYPECGGVK